MSAVASSSRVMLRGAGAAATSSGVKQAISTNVLARSRRIASQCDATRYGDVQRRRTHQLPFPPPSRCDVGERGAASSPFLLGDGHFRRYATAAYQQATPKKESMTAAQAGSLSPQAEESGQAGEEKADEEQPDPDEPPKKASIRERLRFLTRRYGWWALGVYLLASVVDFSLVFAAIHMLGADQIRALEDRLRVKLGLGTRKMEDDAVAAWPVPITTPVEGTAQQVADGGVSNNQNAAREALLKRGSLAEAASGSAASSPAQQTAESAATKASGSSSASGNSSSTLWTEAVLAYTIHKTLLLPFRVGVTAAITPSFVKWMVRHGWARDNAAVHQAAARAKAARAARKTATAGAQRAK